MYLHLGEKCVVTQRDVVGIFNIYNTKTDETTKNFLKSAQDKKILKTAYEDKGAIPKSFVLVSDKSKKSEKVIYSLLSSKTLSGRGV